MSAQNVLDRVKSSGLTARLKGDRLNITPKRRITAELRDDIQKHRGELIQLLRTKAPEEAPSPVTVPAQNPKQEAEQDTRVICWTCANYRLAKSDRPEPGYCLFENPPDGEGKWRFPGVRRDCTEWRQGPRKDEKTELVRSLRVVPPASADLLDPGDCDGICWKCKTPCAPRNQKEQGRTTTGTLPCVGCAHLGTCSKPLDGALSFADLCACDGTPGPGPKAATCPDDQARVKCSHCVRLTITGTIATCSATRQPITDGISLLRTCGKFIGKQA